MLLLLLYKNVFINNSFIYYYYDYYCVKLVRIIYCLQKTMIWSLSYHPATLPVKCEFHVKSQSSFKKIIKSRSSPLRFRFISTHFHLSFNILSVNTTCVSMLHQASVFLQLVCWDLCEY